MIITVCAPLQARSLKIESICRARQPERIQIRYLLQSTWDAVGGGGRALRPCSRPWVKTNVTIPVETFDEIGVSSSIHEVRHRRERNFSRLSENCSPTPSVESAWVDCGARSKRLSGLL